MFFGKYLVGIRVNQLKLNISNRYRKVFRGRCGMIRYRVLGFKIQADIIAITFCRLHNDKHTKYSPHKNCVNRACFHNYRKPRIDFRLHLQILNFQFYKENLGIFSCLFPGSIPNSVINVSFDISSNCGI